MLLLTIHNITIAVSRLHVYPFIVPCLRRFPRVGHIYSGTVHRLYLRTGHLEHVGSIRSR